MLDCIVIGAGPGGLVTTKELVEQGLCEVICLEQTGNIGGVFANTYDSLVLTSSCTFSMFSDFWIGDGNQYEFWTKNEAVDYWKRYAKHFGVLDKIRFNAKVLEVSERDNEEWQIKLASGETLLSKRVAVAIGNNSIPNYPQWKDLLTEVEFSHSQDYRNANNFVGKNVLVVGGGESASDIALEISRVANNCWVSLRNSTGFVVPRKRGERANDIASNRGIYGLPREYGNTLSKIISQRWLTYKDPLDKTAVKLNKKVKSRNGAWGTYGTKTYALPKAIVYHKCNVVGKIIGVEDGGRTLLAASGEVLHSVDAVVFCTGYQNYVSFLPDALKETDPRSLYKHMLHSQYRDKIVWIGWARPGFGSQFPIMEMQARFFASICTGEQQLPTSEQMEEVASMERQKYLQQFEHNATRIRSLVDYHIYMDELADLIGCKPPLWKYFFLNPCLWVRLVYGATQATQFRLRGPGQKETFAKEAIAKLPVTQFNYFFLAGLRGRTIYGFKAIVKGLTAFWKKSDLENRKQINL
ncbi:MAG: NAD(P)-binding domain-containing protein [Okeania sp. SIO2G4]|uniref:flavin-containing monooxygenase n=1 Tax=unclassified Okeania TaxID=2634635 RepID=UPI0013BDEC1B|nr:MULTISPECIES: NAD(P)-binding domain-containing protein [unclassified Okeania]NEP38964.1 NAD(P)-binding domain-containing protein [Okeania sp. SIO2H7]NEP71245.1 NAD(P)-binding domain-containing protein [Okeania sp. SIO2G5]NEP92159.1 NAD(P)-binding domain-containing protein [Okeania sp. SIO2F5]NEQ90188.1 NAD(P)-binding domain-containing protein [Okeania sp. SIO2G4]